MKSIIKNIGISLLALLMSHQLLAQQVSKASTGTFALTNATIETVTNGTVKGTLIISDGKIADIGGNLPIPSGATEIDCAGLTIYPGLIDGGTRLGLAEVGSVSLTEDFNEIGDATPQMQALTAVNPNSVAIPVTRVNGVTTVITKPSGGVMPGTASLIHLLGYTPKQMYGDFQAVVINYPSSGRRGRFDRRSDEDIKKAEEKALKKLNDVFDEAYLYHRIDSAAAGKAEMMPDYNPALAALLPVVRKEIPVMVEVNAAKDIQSALRWVEEKDLNVIFTGVAEGWRVADEIAAAKIPVITGPVLSLPTRQSDRYNRAYTNAAALHKAGVKVALRTDDAENVRNLPFNAGFAAAYGMGKEEALKAVTIVPAEIFGLDDQIGSLEKGKIANLFVTDGDPFEPKTQIKHLFISGYNIPLDSRHIRLYNEFLDREPGLSK
ncbi:amidohydrolase family protein [Flavilitoribacter nigricans]|uniref:Amidohydrolase n=1 Tax=Flavilitoribacter nigricans (strain ATCC 23147 / DSM 23189 / NBRC 102662 / NCIMB 1420 / SS-2) TaxID=1122177 RepID=A0A2D0NA74_FLAN2|nr:amidohydrolase family protein [Flavilitoribacter nigricans]PHN05422.1 amidohydrolase [Flavilitoribacter nigricans DSM 23189 = NBRC 102662]